MIKVGYVPEKISDWIYEVLCRDNTFPWFYQEFTSKYNGNAEVLQLKGYEEHPYFCAYNLDRSPDTIECI